MKSGTGQAKGGALTPEDFQGSGGAEDRRKELRLPCQREIAVMPCAGPDGRGFRRVSLSDCSPHGLGVVSNEPMAPGDEFLAKLKLKKLILLVYRVQHCAALGAGGAGPFRIGAELIGTIGPPDDAEADATLKAILGQAD